MRIEPQKAVSRTKKTQQKKEHPAKCVFIFQFTTTTDERLMFLEHTK